MNDRSGPSSCEARWLPRQLGRRAPGEACRGFGAKDTPAPRHSSEIQLQNAILDGTTDDASIMERSTLAGNKPQLMKLRTSPGIVGAHDGSIDRYLARDVAGFRRNELSRRMCGRRCCDRASRLCWCADRRPVTARAAACARFAWGCAPRYRKKVGNRGQCWSRHGGQPWRAA